MSNARENLVNQLDTPINESIDEETLAFIPRINALDADSIPASTSLLQRALNKLKQSAKSAFRKTLEAEIVPESQGFFRTVVRPSLIETSLVTGYSYAISRFIKNDTFTTNPIPITLAMCAGNFLTRILNYYPRNNPDDFFLFIRVVGRYYRSTFYAMMDESTRIILMHEGAHALMGLLLYQNANPRIEIIPSGFYNYDGDTYVNATTLSRFGTFVGRTDSSGLVDAAGVFSELISDYFSIVVAQLFQDDYPELSSHLRMTVLINLYQLLYYALHSCIPGDDFCDLENVDSALTHGVDIGIIVGSLVFLQAAVSLLDHALKPRRQTNTNDIPHAEVIEDADENRRLGVR